MAKLSVDQLAHREATDLTTKLWDNVLSKNASMGLVKADVYKYCYACIFTIIDNHQNGDFNELKAKVRAYMRDHPGCLQTEIANALKLTPTAVSRTIKSLRADWEAQEKEPLTIVGGAGR